MFKQILADIRAERTQKYDIKKLKGRKSLFSFQRILIISGAKITTGSHPQEIPHQETVVPKMKLTVIIPKAAGLKICWRTPVAINCFDKEAKIEARIIT